MKCIDKCIKLVICGILVCCLTAGCVSPGKSISAYESEDYERTSYRAAGFSNTICVAADNVLLEPIKTDSSLHAAGLFSLNENKVLYSYNIHKKLYPASTTKILTALIALKYGNLSDTVTISQNATTFPAGASLCHVREGDTITLEELLYGLLLPSGNDAAVAIAEHISGSVEEFAKLMNSEAYRIGATNTHFVNPHGLHDDNHYTTAYDLYLIFNECLKHEMFTNIIGQSSHQTSIANSDGSKRDVTWESTVLYMNGNTGIEVEKPSTVTFLGGKTGNTDEAKRCLLGYSRDGQNNAYISIVMGAETKPLVYVNMNEMLNNAVAAN